MRFRTAIASLLVIPATLAGQAPPSRSVTGNRLDSPADPRASFLVSPALTYKGGQAIDIFKAASAEQYFFAQLAPDSSIQRFYLLQFEHYHPTNSYTYDYSDVVQQPITIGTLPFMGDIRTIPNLFTDYNTPGSDSEAAATYLRGRGIRLDGSFVTLRLIHLPDSAKRRELMIVYGERVGQLSDSAGVRRTLLAHATAGLAIR